MKKIVIGTIALIVLFGCGLLTYTVVSGLDLNFTNPILVGGPNTNAGEGTGSNPSLNIGGPNTNAGEGTGSNPSLNIGGPNTNAGEGTGSNPNMVGGASQPACQENPTLQIEPLVENGTVIPNAFMGLDLNRTEVDAGLRYVLDVPTGTYVQYFQAWDGTTWEAVGPTQVTATAWTSWCNNSGWISQNGFPTGQHRQLNANRLPEAIGQWITK